jgi:hypothetical protein
VLLTGAGTYFAFSLCAKLPLEQNSSGYGGVSTVETRCVDEDDADLLIEAGRSADETTHESGPSSDLIGSIADERESGGGTIVLLDAIDSDDGGAMKEDDYDTANNTEGGESAAPTFRF